MDSSMEEIPNHKLISCITISKTNQHKHKFDGNLKENDLTRLQIKFTLKIL